MAKKSGPTKAERKAAAIARAVHAGEPCDCETVDFSDPDRLPTCLEVDFPILPINQIAAIEGNAGKPIYQMSKWWARRRSSVFRALLIAAAMKAPKDPTQAAKQVWDAYYRNHQINGKFKHLKVADIFMGGGTTIVEGSRLGMQMYGNDYNPVAWFVVKNEMAKVDRAELEKALADIEAEVKPQIMPFYACGCPRGHKGKWIRIADGKSMGEDFDPLALSPGERKRYSYSGPETIYVFWAKHGPCQVRGCGHRTPIMSSPVMAEKELTVKYWERKCGRCGDAYDIEAGDPRMAPGVPLVWSDAEKPAAPGRFDVGLKYPVGAVCPCCGKDDAIGTSLPKAKTKKVQLYLLVHPEWLAGESAADPDGNPYGGSSGDGAEATAAWNRARAAKCRLVEVRGEFPKEITCPETGATFSTQAGTVPKKSHYACAQCGTVQDVLETVRVSSKTGPVAMYAIQGYCPDCDNDGQPYGGRFFSPMHDATTYNAALHEWTNRREKDLKKYWPRSRIPIGAEIGPHDVEGHHYSFWYTMFNERQLLVHSLLLRKIVTINHSALSETILGAFQQYLRNQNMFCFWNLSADKMEPLFSKGNFHPKATVIENGVFSNLGRGNWASSCESLTKTLSWIVNPWELCITDYLRQNHPEIELPNDKSTKVTTNDTIIQTNNIYCVSSTELTRLPSKSIDLIVTDPPFGNLEQYAELSDFFYVWMKIALSGKYPDCFSSEYSPKTLETVSNNYRHPENPDLMYERLLTKCWQEANRVLKSGGMLAFTFHHKAFNPWVAVLESLFHSGFVLVATIPILADESKGSGFGSETIEFDIIHVCRKRTKVPERVSWPKMRRAILQDVASIKDIIELHQKEGLPEADLQVIRIGKALEYYSRHYGQVYKNDDELLTVKDALIGIINVIDDSDGEVKMRPPDSLEPATRIFMSLFDGRESLPRDQMQKSLRHTGIAPDDYEQRGWCRQERKVYHLVSPLDIATAFRGQKRQRISNDYDQAMLLIGACYDHSGIRVEDILGNPNFHPHPALGALVEWLKTRGANEDVRNAASRAHDLYKKWIAKEASKEAQGTLF